MIAIVHYGLGSVQAFANISRLLKSLVEVSADPDFDVGEVVSEYAANNSIVIGVDATNLRGGGGQTHLTELLRAASPEIHGFKKVVVWGGRDTLDRLEDHPWLVKIRPQALDRGLAIRTFWQRCHLSGEAWRNGCDILFVPGGSYAGGFRPVVTMSQNLLPFETGELLRYGISAVTLKGMLLRLVQSSTFRQADGVIFLTRYAMHAVTQVTGPLENGMAVIPHGVSHRFFTAPRVQNPISCYAPGHPFRLLYVSIIDQYKHQWRLVEAIGRLRKRHRWPLALDLVGPSYPPALVRLQESLQNFDPGGEWVTYHGPIPYERLHAAYASADLGVFCSSCENMPNILLETMGAGLPVACANRGPMPEVLGDAGVYFDPERPDDIARALTEMIESPELRASLAKASYERTQRYSWKRCANETFAFLRSIAADAGHRKNKRKKITG